jgi:hypothetical protein
MALQSQSSRVYSMAKDPEGALRDFMGGTRSSAGGESGEKKPYLSCPAFHIESGLCLRIGSTWAKKCIAGCEKKWEFGERHRKLKT